MAYIEVTGDINKYALRGNSININGGTYRLPKEEFNGCFDNGFIECLTGTIDISFVGGDVLTLTAGKIFNLPSGGRPHQPMMIDGSAGTGVAEYEL